MLKNLDEVIKLINKVDKISILENFDRSASIRLIRNHGYDSFVNYVNFQELYATLENSEKSISFYPFILPY